MLNAREGKGRRRRRRPTLSLLRCISALLSVLSFCKKRQPHDQRGYAQNDCYAISHRSVSPLFDSAKSKHARYGLFTKPHEATRNCLKFLRVASCGFVEHLLFVSP